MVRTLSDNNLDDSDRKLLSDIERVGWHVVMIQEYDSIPGWAFSVGLFKTFNHPEIVVFGLPLELSGQVINGIGTDIQRGITFNPSQEYRDILEDVLCTFRPVTQRWYPPFLGYAEWYYRGDDFPVLQCIWPDKQQHYPWQPEFNKAWLRAQPLLFEPEPEEARVGPFLESMGS